MKLIECIAKELSVAERQVAATINLLDDGASVPFIARYRKEATGGLDDNQLRTLEERLIYLRELNDRRTTVLDSIKGQGKLTPELEAAIHAAVSKTVLEDLYLPFKPKRRNKAQLAREAGLEALLDALLADRDLQPSTAAEAYINLERGVPDRDAALEGARQIFMERVSEDAVLLAKLREQIWRDGVLHSTVVKGKEEDGRKFSDYFEFSKRIAKIPSHRALALFRGRNEQVLRLKLAVAEDEAGGNAQCERMVRVACGVENTVGASQSWLYESARLAWKIKLFTRIDLDLKLRLRERAEQEAIRVFAGNLNDRLLAAPAGGRVTLGLDPGLRTGVKAAVVDGTGQLKETATLYPHAPQRKWDASIDQLAQMIQRHTVELVSIGNGTGSRETDQLVADVSKRHPELSFTRLIVSEAGASVYSASELAANEFPDLDVTVRGAVSIARRLQDPLAELVKIEPKSIGVGQYQHDVNQTLLSRSLDSVIEDCVNAVGVDVNTASAALLSKVSGLTPTIGKNIVDYRNANGPFKNREQLNGVPRLGAKTFEQAAGFLRITGGENPLDASAVHPEAYPVAERMVAATGQSIDRVIGQAQLLRGLRAGDFTTEAFGLPTIRDILGELEKPGRDPRPAFKTAQFKEGVESIADLKAGMRLEGTVTNVTNFGAFVDIGVHQDGLVHISQLADRFVKDPRDVVKTGDTVHVKVVEVDAERRRIALTLRSSDGAAEGPRNERQRPNKNRAKQREQPPKRPQGAMAEALSRALNK